MAKILVASSALSLSPRPVIPQPPPPPCPHHPRAVPSSYSQKSAPRTPTRHHSVRAARARDTAEAMLMSGKAPLRSYLCISQQRKYVQKLFSSRTCFFARGAYEPTHYPLRLTVVQASLMKPQWRQARHDDAGRSAWQQQQRRASMSTPVVAGLTFVPESAYDFGVWDPNYRA